MTADRYLVCPQNLCPKDVWVSPEDEDGSFSQMWAHVQDEHADYDSEKTSEMMAKVREITR